MNVKQKNYDPLKQALEYSQIGRVFPLMKNQKIPKKGFSWKEKATNNPELIKKYWTDYPNANVGLVTGNGIIVIDLDTKNGVNGIDNLDTYLISKGSSLATLTKGTFQVQSPSGGLHFYFKTKKKYKNSNGGVLEGVDIRADEGGYIVAPPSRLNNGEYKALTSFDLRELPPELDELLSNPPNKNQNIRFKLPEIIKEGTRNDILFRYGGSLRGRGYGDEEIRKLLTQANKERCQPMYPEQKLETIINQVLKFERRFKNTDSTYQKLLELNVLNGSYTKDDKGFSSLFSEVFKDEARFNPIANQWFIFDGSIWVKDYGGMLVQRLAKKFVDSLYRLSMDIESTEEKKKFIKSISTLGSLTTRNRIINDAQEVNHILYNNFDEDDYKLNCLNGVLDLKTLELIPHNKSADLLLTKISGVEYKPEVDYLNSLFFKTLAEVFEGDTERVTYLQKLIGYCLTGSTKEEKAFIFYGATTRNGKSTILEAINNMLGGSRGYSISSQPHILEQRKNNDTRNASGDIARLEGARFLTLGEIPKGMILNESLLKSFTGRDTITARALYEAEKEFQPKFKLVINANHLPKVTDSTLFMSNRLVVIPFNKHFSEKEQNKDLKDLLNQPQELSAVLNWALEGLKMYRDEGLQAPLIIEKAIKDYERNSDKLGLFIDDCLLIGDEANGNDIQGQTVYECYQNWCKDNGYRSEGRNNFYELMKTKGYYLETWGRVNGIRKRTVFQNMDIATHEMMN